MHTTYDTTDARSTCMRWLMVSACTAVLAGIAFLSYVSLADQQAEYMVRFHLLRASLSLMPCNDEPSRVSGPSSGPSESPETYTLPNLDRLCSFTHDKRCTNNEQLQTAVAEYQKAIEFARREMNPMHPLLRKTLLSYINFLRANSLDSSKQVELLKRLENPSSFWLSD